MLGTAIRRAAMVVAVPALVAGASASPAIASDKGYDDDYDKSVTIKVCKHVKYDDDYGYDDHKGKKPKFKIYVKTDEDYAKVKVRDGQCKKVELDYEYAYFKVYEKYVPEGYEFDYRTCSYGAYDDEYDKYKCTFDDDDDYVKVDVYNKKKDKEHDDDY